MKISTLLIRGMHHENFNEDFFYTHSLSNDLLVCAVMDGCSSAKDSHFTSSLFAKSLDKSSRMLPQMHEIMEDFLLDNMELEAIAEFYMMQLFNDLKRAKKLFFLERDELLSTIVLMVIDKKEKLACIKMSGDGMFSVNGEVTEIDQNNMPNFLGYHLSSSFEEVKNSEIQTWNFNNVSDISISTDGVDKLKTTSQGLKKQQDPRKFLLSGDSDGFQNSFLREKYNSLVKKGFVPYDDICVIRCIDENKKRNLI